MVTAAMAGWASWCAWRQKGGESAVARALPPASRTVARTNQFRCGSPNGCNGNEETSRSARSRFARSSRRPCGSQSRWAWIVAGVAAISLPRTTLPPWRHTTSRRTVALRQRRPRQAQVPAHQLLLLRPQIKRSQLEVDGSGPGPEPQLRGAHACPWPSSKLNRPRYSV